MVLVEPVESQEVDVVKGQGNPSCTGTEHPWFGCVFCLSLSTRRALGFAVQIPFGPVSFSNLRTLVTNHQNHVTSQRENHCRGERSKQAKQRSVAMPQNRTDAFGELEMALRTKYKIGDDVLLPFMDSN